VEGFGPTGPKPDDSRLGWFLCSVALSAVPGLSVVVPPVGGYSGVDLGVRGVFIQESICMQHSAVADSFRENQRFHVG